MIFENSRMNSFLSLLEHGSVRVFESNRSCELFQPFFFTSAEICRELVWFHYHSFIGNPVLHGVRSEYFHQLQTRGFLCIPGSTIYRLLGSKNIEQLEHYSSFILDQENTQKKRLTFHSPLEIFYNDLLADLLISTGLLEVFNCIFSEEGMEICGGQLFVATRSTSTVSPTDSAYYWHRDSVGRRFKVWLVLHSTEYSPRTCIIARSNYQDPIPRQWEMLRAHKEFIRDNGQSLINSINAHNDFASLNYPPFSLVVIDTNSIHRGDYDPLDIGVVVMDTSRIFLEMTIRGKRSGLIFDQFKKDIEADRDLRISSRHHALCSPSNLII